MGGEGAESRTLENSNLKFDSFLTWTLSQVYFFFQSNPRQFLHLLSPGITSFPALIPDACSRSQRRGKRSIGVAEEGSRRRANRAITFFLSPATLSQRRYVARPFHAVLGVSRSTSWYFWLCAAPLSGGAAAPRMTSNHFLSLRSRLPNLGLVSRRGVLYLLQC